MKSKEIQLTEKLHGILETAAQYSWRHNLIMIPESLGKERELLTIDGIDHELWHVIYDALEYDDIPNYSGPSLKEISEYCRNKVKSKEFNKLLLSIQKLEIYERMKTFSKHLISTYEFIDFEFIMYLNSIRSFMESHKGKVKLAKYQILGF